jgi:hypothetical protein
MSDTWNGNPPKTDSIPDVSVGAYLDLKARVERLEQLLEEHFKNEGAHNPGWAPP